MVERGYLKSCRRAFLKWVWSCTALAGTPGPSCHFSRFWSSSRSGSDSPRIIHNPVSLLQPQRLLPLIGLRSFLPFVYHHRLVSHCPTLLALARVWLDSLTLSLETVRDAGHRCALSLPTSPVSLQDITTSRSLAIFNDFGMDITPR